MNIAGRKATVTKRYGHCMVTVTLTVFDVLWVYFNHYPDKSDWDYAIKGLARHICMPLKQMRNEFDGTLNK